MFFNWIDVDVFATLKSVRIYYIVNIFYIRKSAPGLRQGLVEGSFLWRAIDGINFLLQSLLQTNLSRLQTTVHCPTSWPVKVYLTTTMIIKNNYFIAQETPIHDIVHNYITRKPRSKYIWCILTDLCRWQWYYL